MMGSFIKYRLKIFLKNKTMIFWTLLFPIALTTMFYFVFSDIQFVDEVKPFKIAVVDGKNTNVKQLLSSLSDKQSENYLLDVIYASEDEAKALVKEQEVEAMVVLDNPVQLVSIRMGYNQTIMKSVLNTYERVFSQVNHIALENPQALSDLVIEDLLKSDVYFHTLNSQGSQKDMNTTYFYTALALLCMYGALWGCIITHDIQANQSKRAARLNLAPISKKKLLFADFTLAYGLISLELFLLFAYMKFVLHVAFGHQLWLMLCVCLAGILAMLSVGVLFGTLKLNWNNKVGIVSGSIYTISAISPSV
ncbi:MAG: ABC transporter permease, partial [Erysipelotrichia bacterium]|nr:ABC transporter permease [Erysipelotrichia bacterium]